MKLEEEIFQVFFYEDSIPRIVNAKLTKRGIAKVENFTIRFNDWVQINAYKYPTSTTTKELLEIYKETL